MNEHDAEEWPAPPPLPVLRDWRLEAHIEQCGRWGPMKWSGWITHGPTQSGNWYAATRKGIERKMRRALRRRELERVWRENRARVLPPRSPGDDR